MCVPLTRNNHVHRFKSLRPFVGDTYHVIRDSYNVGFAVIHWSCSLFWYKSVHTRTHTHTHSEGEMAPEYSFSSAVFQGIVDQASSTFWFSELIVVIVTQQESFPVSRFLVFGDSLSCQADIPVEKTPVWLLLVRVRTEAAF